MRKKQSGHGGKRAGAGRPAGITGAHKSADEKRVTIGVRLPAYMVEWLKKQELSSGRIIEGALVDAYGKSIKNYKGGK